MIEVSGKDKGLEIKGLKELNFNESKVNYDSVYAAIEAVNGAKVKVNNVGTINFGTKDNPLTAVQGLNAQGGTIDVTADNINGTVQSAGFLMAQSTTDTGTGTTYLGKLTVMATYDVNLTSNFQGLMTAGIYQNIKGIETVNSLTAGGKINLCVTGEKSSDAEKYGVVGVTDNYKGSYGEGGTGQLTVSGNQGVNIISDKGKGVINSLGGTNQKGTITIESTNGDVSIHTKQQAIEVNGNSAKTNSPNNNSAKIDIKGANINVVSEKNTAILVDTNSNVQLGTNRDNGTIYISGGNGIAADVKGNNSQLNLGNGDYNTTVQLKGQINVADGANVTVADKTTTVVDATSLGKGQSLISATNGGTFTAKENAKLVVKGANTGASLYTKDNGITFWTIKNTSFDNPFQYLSKDGTVQAGITDANKESIAGYAASSVCLAATTANDAKLKPLLTNVDSWNSAAGIGQAAGIQHSTYAVTGLFTDALSDHDDTKDKDLWAKGFHSKENIDGLGFAGGALSLDTQYNGTVVGMDVYQNEHTTAGVALTYADGNISSSNGGVYTKNDATYVGASLYGLKDLGSYRLAADLSYVGDSHDITQRNAGQVITAKPDTEAWTLGVKAMKDYDLARGTLTPYVGLRYLRLTTDGYTSSIGLSYDKENQNLFLLPVGVDYSLAVKRGSWEIKPYAGLSYIWTMGDRNADQTVSYGSASDVFSYDITDARSFLGKVGISASKGDYSFGVGYTYQTGNTVDSHTWSVKASYAF